MLRLGLEQLENGSFEDAAHWSSEGKPVRVAGPGRTGAKSLALADGQLTTQKLKRKVIPSATYLLEFLYRVDDVRTRLVAGALLGGGKETLTASKLRARPGGCAFDRLAVKTMADTASMEAVALVRGNHRRFLVVHFPDLLHTDAIEVLPGPHRARRECLTEIEVYGPLGGPEMAGRGKAFPSDPHGVPMFMGAPSHVPARLPADLVGEYVELGRMRATFPAYNVGGTVVGDTFTYGDANGRILSMVVRTPEPKDRHKRWLSGGPTWRIGTITPTTTAARYAGRLLVGSADRKLHAVADNGMHLWAYPTAGRVYASPVPEGDEVYFGSDDGRLYKVDVDSGILIWEFATGNKVRSAPALVLLSEQRKFFSEKKLGISFTAPLP